MITFHPPRSSAPLPPELVAPPVVHTAPATDITREQIATRVAACRACEHAAPGATACEACALRCAHPSATPAAQIIARRESACPANLWPVSQ